MFRFLLITHEKYKKQEENISKEKLFNKIGTKLTRNIQSLDKIRLLKKLQLCSYCLKP